MIARRDDVRARIEKHFRRGAIDPVVFGAVFSVDDGKFHTVFTDKASKTLFEIDTGRRSADVAQH